MEHPGARRADSREGEPGGITLGDDVNYRYQKDDAERVVRRITGVRGATNLIMIAQHAVPDIKRRIKEAL